MTPEKFELMYRIHLNGIHAMHSIARKSKNPDEPHNTAFWDCKIGAKNAGLALNIFEDKVPPLVYRFLKNHYSHELCHCCMGPSIVKEEMANRISGFHARIMREHGIVSYLACMPLMGERCALSTALFHRYEDDPHSTIVGGLDEYYHTTTPLLILAYLDPSVKELEQALKDQEQFMKIMGVTEEDRAYPRIDDTLCTLEGREAHNI